jgi:hypothetical protein
MNYTTYYRKDVWERFKDEPDKSDLINRLLAEHYDDVAEEKVIKVADYNSPASKSKLCKHGSVKGGCFSKEAPRMKCNV